MGRDNVTRPLSLPNLRTSRIETSCEIVSVHALKVFGEVETLNGSQWSASRLLSLRPEKLATVPPTEKAALVPELVWKLCRIEKPLSSI